MDKGPSLKILRNFKFGPNEEWQPGKKENEADAREEVRKRKVGREVGFMQYDPSHVGKDAGEFVRVQTKTRLNLLRAAKEAKGESILDNSVLNLNNQVITTNLGYKRSKKRKNYYNKYAKAPIQIKTKFESTAQIRSDWIEVAKVEFNNLKKNKIEHSTSVLSESASTDRKFKGAFLKKRSKKFHKVRTEQSGFIPPHDVQKDEELKRLYETEKIPKGKIGVFISENALYTLGAINISKFPFVMKVKREGNKFMVWYEVSPENCFLFWESYRESTNENYIESEQKIQKLSLESTQVMEAFQIEAINPPDKSFEKHANTLDKKDLEEKREKAKDGEFKRGENWRIVRIDLNEEVSVYTRLSLEGQNSKGQEILVKALYDVPKLLNNKNKGDDVFLDCIQYNSFRITKWMVQAFFLGRNN